MFRLASWDQKRGRTGFAGFDGAEATGECYPWAYHYVMKNPDAILVQGTVVNPDNGQKMGHAWVEHDGRAKDWQGVEGGIGIKPYRGSQGYPLDIYYELFRPTSIRRYNKEEALVALLKSRGGSRSGGPHYGPWHGKGSTRRAS